MKEWLKSVLNYRSYPKNKTGYPFFGPPCSICLSFDVLSDEQGGSDTRRQRDGGACSPLRLLCHSQRFRQEALPVTEGDQVPADDDGSDRMASDEARTATGDVQESSQASRRHLQDARVAP